MGVATGGMGPGGCVPQVRNSGGRPTEIAIFKEKISDFLAKILRFSNIFKIKYAKSDEKLEFGGRCRF